MKLTIHHILATILEAGAGIIFVGLILATPFYLSLATTRHQTIPF